MPTNPYPVNHINPAYPTDPVRPLGTAGYSATFILSSIYTSIRTVIKSLQSTTVAQANRINLFTNLQSAYTNQLATIPTFQKTTGGHNYTTTQLGDVVRATAAYTQNLQNRQAVIANASKALQSNVDQSNNAVNAQSTLATTLIQQFSTLLASAFSH